MTFVFPSVFLARLRLICLISMTSLTCLSLSACGGSSQSIASPTTTTDSTGATGTTTTASTTTSTGGTSCGIANFDAEMLKAVNAARAVGRSCGTTVMPAVASLSTEARLTQAAATHTLDMAKTLTMDHVGSDGSTVSARVNAVGYTWSSVGENIAWNQRSISAVMSSWISSTGHCENIMNATFTQLGAACQIANDGSWYWTQVFARP